MGELAADPELQDRLPWLHKILKTAKLLTSEEGIAAVGRLAEGTPIPSEPHGETEAALSVIHPGSIHARKGNPSREAVVIGCSALKVAYRDLLRGDGEGVEAYFLYRASLVLSVGMTGLIGA